MSIHATIQWDAETDGYVPRSLHANRADALASARSTDGDTTPIIARHFVVEIGLRDALRILCREAVGRTAQWFLRRIRGEI